MPTPFLLNPSLETFQLFDLASRQIMNKTIEFFENKGLSRIKADDHARAWYGDFLEFQKTENVFARLLTPSAYASDDASRWDTFRNCAFNEILGFYGLAYWYTWQVTILGLGPLWMSANEAAKLHTASLLSAGEVFAFGLSERLHGADIYSTETSLTRNIAGGYLANGKKYYIGNANAAALVSTFGKLMPDNEYVFFAVDTHHPGFEVLQNITASQNYVAEFVLDGYKIEEQDILSRGQDAWDASLNTVNVGKFNLGWASIGICSHALHEAINHAANRRLYNMYVTDFPHVRSMFADAYARLIAMKLFTLRASDYMRSASPEDRRYLLYNPLVKMKVTTQGEQVIDLLWDVIAARGFEKDLFFEMAARDIRAMPKLEGTVHVNIALIVKFLPNYFFNPAEYPPIPLRNDPSDDVFLWQQGPTRGLGKIRFHDFKAVFQRFDLPNVNLFLEQIEAFRSLLVTATPSQAQQQDVDFLLAIGELFASVVYGQLILEAVEFYRPFYPELDENCVEQVFDFLVRDFSKYALILFGKPSTSPVQMSACQQMIRKPHVDEIRAKATWEQVMALKDSYTMKQ